MNYWLCKTEPEVFSIDQLSSKKKTAWTEVRNYQARNFMRDSMKVGDRVLIYHSNAEPSGVAGLARVCSTPHADETAFELKSEYYDPKSKRENPTWICVDVEFVEKFKKLVSLAELKANPRLENLTTLRPGNRLSVMPVEKSHFEEILKMADSKMK